MTHLSLLPAILGYFAAAGMAFLVKLAQAVPSIPEWMEGGAALGFITCLIYATVTLWKRNQKMAVLMQEQADKFHDEVRQEMQAQIDSERQSRIDMTEATRELRNTLEKINTEQSAKCDSVVKRLEGIKAIK